jgi:hypothetical protein
LAAGNPGGIPGQEAREETGHGPEYGTVWKPTRRGRAARPTRFPRGAAPRLATPGTLPRPLAGRIFLSFDARRRGPRRRCAAATRHPFDVRRHCATTIRHRSPPRHPFDNLSRPATPRGRDSTGHHRLASPPPSHRRPVIPSLPPLRVASSQDPVRGFAILAPSLHFVGKGFSSIG